MFKNHPKCHIWVFQFWHFHQFLSNLKLAYLITLLDSRFFKNSPNWPFLAFMINFWRENTFGKKGFKKCYYSCYIVTLLQAGRWRWTSTNGLFVEPHKAWVAMLLRNQFRKSKTSTKYLLLDVTLASMVWDGLNYLAEEMIESLPPFLWPFSTKEP